MATLSYRAAVQHSQSTPRGGNMYGLKHAVVLALTLPLLAAPLLAQPTPNKPAKVNNNYHGGGGCYNCYYHDNDWNWGSFAAGAAVGVATTAVVAAATRPASTTVVVAAPAVGTMVPALPGGCANINSGGVVLYNRNNVYYRPFYQGTTLVYQVVTYP